MEGVLEFQICRDIELIMAVLVCCACFLVVSDYAPSIRRSSASTRSTLNNSQVITQIEISRVTHGNMYYHTSYPEAKIVAVTNSLSELFKVRRYYPLQFYCVKDAVG